MNDVQKVLNCRSCGAPVTSEICPYCGCRTGLDTQTANMDYPVLECKEADLNFWTVLFPLIFAVMFGGGGIMVFCSAFDPEIMHGSGEKMGLGSGFMMIFSLPFLLVGIGAAVIVIKRIYRYILIKNRGKIIDAVVYGYANDIVSMNNTPAQVVKLLVDTPEGKRFVMYQLGKTSRPFGINTTIRLKVYRDCFLIENKKENINW